MLNNNILFIFTTSASASQLQMFNTSVLIYYYDYAEWHCTRYLNKYIIIRQNTKHLYAKKIDNLWDIKNGQIYWAEVDVTHSSVLQWAGLILDLTQ